MTPLLFNDCSNPYAYGLCLHTHSCKSPRRPDEMTQYLITGYLNCSAKHSLCHCASCILAGGCGASQQCLSRARQNVRQLQSSTVGLGAMHQCLSRQGNSPVRCQAAVAPAYLSPSVSVWFLTYRNVSMQAQILSQTTSHTNFLSSLYNLRRVTNAQSICRQRTPARKL